MSEGLWRVLLHLLRSEGRRVKLAPPAKSRDFSRLRPALELVDRSLGSPGLSVAELADSVNLSEVYLRKMFRRLTGMAPVDYIRRRRVERAASLLRETSVPLKTIAESCGFSDLSFFHHVFRALTGQTPSRFRNASGTGI